MNNEVTLELLLQKYPRAEVKPFDKDKARVGSGFSYDSGFNYIFECHMEGKFTVSSFTIEGNDLTTTEVTIYLPQ